MGDGCMETKTLLLPCRYDLLLLFFFFLCTDAGGRSCFARADGPAAVLDRSDDSSSCKARYAVLFQIWTLPSKPEDEAHIGPTATYDEVIYPGFQHDITAYYRYKDTTSHTRGIQVPEHNTSARGTCLSTDYNQMPSGKSKTHHSRNRAGPGSPPGTPS